MDDAITFPGGVSGEQLIEELRGAGAVFALVFGSRVGSSGGTLRPDSDLDVGAWWAADPPHSWQAHLPVAVDLTVLNTAPLRVAGRVAMEGVVLFDDEPAARVRWQAQFRKRFVDERPRWQRADDVFRAAVLDG